MPNNPLLEKSYSLSLQTLRLCNSIAKIEKEYVITKQLSRSGTSIGANLQEACEAQSRNDFISKLKIALKESRESMYWFRLLSDLHKNRTQDISPCIHLLDEVIAMTVKSIATAKSRK